MEKTSLEYTNVINLCREIFEKKTRDYGTSWRILRPSSLTDQIFIKAQRIRTVQETGENKVGETFEDAFMGIVNYCIMAIFQLRNDSGFNEQLTLEEAMKVYNEISTEAFELMKKKNHDYGEAWRDMRVTSLTDLILTKVLRIKQIEDNKGKEPLSTYLGGLYGFLPPSDMVAKNAGEWQSYDITLIGRMVTIVCNGITVISNQEIPGITGGALDSKEGEAGPIYLQGDHGPVEFRNIIITPAK